jgi:RHS repeat-associated protein
MMGRMLAMLVLAVLCWASPLMADVSAGVTTYRVTIVLYPGDDAAAVAKRLAAMYQGTLETPVDERGTFVIAVSDATAELLRRDPAVETMQSASPSPSAASASASTSTSTPPDRPVGTTGVATSWTLGTYTYDSSGNIKTIGTNSYRYDALSRLLVADASASGIPKQTYTYDQFGNLLTIDTAGSGKTTLTIAGLTNRLSTISSGSLSRTISYDTAGNLVADGDATYEYDALNVMTKSVKGSTTRSYVYTASDERIGTSEQTGSSTRSEWTIRDPQGKVLRRYSKEGGVWKWQEDYIYRGSQLLAAEVPDSTRTRHFHLDHLGTPRLVTGNGGAEISRHTYHPFGEEIPSTPAINAPRTKLQFTGHERDAESLDYMHARFYAPYMGRFLSVDPGRDWDPKQPQSWNMYAYSRNDPVLRVDPDGRSSLVFNRKHGYIAFYSGEGTLIGAWSAANNADSRSRGSKRWPAGEYSMLDRTQPRTHARGDTVDGEYGTRGIFRAQNFDDNGVERTGMGVHAGRQNATDGAGRSGVEHATMGCIRTTEDAMKIIAETAAVDPVETIRVEDEPVPPRTDLGIFGIYMLPVDNEPPNP